MISIHTTLIAISTIAVVAVMWKWKMVIHKMDVAKMESLLKKFIVMKKKWVCRFYALIALTWSIDNYLHLLNLIYKQM